MGRLAAAGLALALSSLVAAPPARAEAEGRARALFAQGVERFAEGRYEGALASFVASYRARPYAPVLYNVAMCQRALDRPEDSVRTFRRYLSESGSALPPDRGEEVLALIEEMTPGAGWLRVEVEPPEAQVSVDGQTVTPAELWAVRLPPGPHEVVARAPERISSRQEVVVVASRPSDVRLVLAPAVRAAAAAAVPPDEAPPAGLGRDSRTAPAPEARDRRPLHEQWWLWTALSVVVVAAVATGVGVGLSQGSGGGPEPGDWEVRLR